MKFNSFHYVESSIDDMKKLLFPIKFRTWLKLGFVSLLSSNVGGGSPGGGNGMNFNIPGDFNRDTIKTVDARGIPANSTDSAVQVSLQNAKVTLGGWYYWIFPIALLMIALGLLMSYITSTFSFIFLESLVTRKVQIKKGWHRNKPLGWSFFLFRIVYGLIVLGIIILFSLPFLIPMMTRGFSEYFDSFQFISFVWLIPLGFLFLLVLILAGVAYSLIFHFSVVHMYFTKRPAKQSIKETFRKIWKKKIEVFVFLIARIVIGIVMGIAAALVFFIMLIPWLIIVAPFAFIIYALSGVMGWGAVVITLTALLGIALIILLIYSVSVALLPLSTFSRYFSINNYKVLMN